MISAAVLLHSAITLAMLGVLFRWTAPYLEVDIHRGRFGWLPRLVDPYINLVRRVLPAMGPMDFGPVASILLLWLVRVITTGG